MRLVRLLRVSLIVDRKMDNEEEMRDGNSDSGLVVAKAVWHDNRRHDKYVKMEYNAWRFFCVSERRRIN